MECSALLGGAPEPAGQGPWAAQPGPGNGRAEPRPRHRRDRIFEAPNFYTGDPDCHCGRAEEPARGDQGDDRGATGATREMRRLMTREDPAWGDERLSRSWWRLAKTVGSVVVLLACGTWLVAKLVTSAPRAGAARTDDAAPQGGGNRSLRRFFGRMSPEALPSLRQAAGLSDRATIEKAEERAFREQTRVMIEGMALIEKAKAASSVGRAEEHMSGEGRQAQGLVARATTTTTAAELQETRPPSKKAATTTESSRGRGPAAGVGECARDGESCLASRCCASPGRRCFRVNEWWAACNATCSTGHQRIWDQDGWDCTELGNATSEAPETLEEDPQTPSAPANASSCADSGEQCMEVRCCSDPGMQCFRMNAYWASCNLTCSQRRTWNESMSAWVDSDGPAWDCEQLRPNGSAGRGARGGNASRRGGNASRRSAGGGNASRRGGNASRRRAGGSNASRGGGNASLRGAGGGNASRRGGNASLRAPSSPSRPRGNEVVYMRN